MNTDVTIRAPRESDIQALTALLNAPGVQSGTARLPFTPEAFVRVRITGDRAGVHGVVAELESRIVGWATLVAGTDRRAHSGEVGLSVHDTYWGRGIGRALMGALLALADEWLGLRRVELEVATDNSRAIRLYEAAGFETEGRKRGAIIKGGTLADTLIMARLRPALERQSKETAA
ncbi:MAG: GNAT family N-acetyltransferase [Pseudomonadota bacterium]